MKKTIIKVKAFMDFLKNDFAEYLAEPVLDCIPYHYEDEVWEFELVIQKVKNITKEIGIDKDGEPKFTDVEVKEIKQK